MFRLILQFVALLAALYTFVGAYDPSKKAETFGTETNLVIKEEEGEIRLNAGMGLKYCRVFAQCEDVAKPRLPFDQIDCDYGFAGQKVVCHPDQVGWVRIEKQDEKGNATYFEWEAGTPLVLHCRQNSRPLRVVGWQVHSDGKYADSIDFAWRRTWWNRVFVVLLLASTTVVFVTAAETLTKYIKRPGLQGLDQRERADLILKVTLSNPRETVFARQLLAFWIERLQVDNTYDNPVPDCRPAGFDFSDFYRAQIWTRARALYLEQAARLMLGRP